MVMTPLKALLFLLGGTVAAGTVGYVTGVFDGMLPQRPAMVAALPDSPEKPAETPAAAAPAQPEASVPAPAAPVAAPASGETPDAPESDTRTGEAAVVPPSFDIVRVEPDGSVVIAGKASSNGEVEVLAGAEILARTVAGVDGDFAVVLDDPLKPGDYQVVLRDTSPAKEVATSVETAIISVPDSGSGQVLALVEEPGKPSRLITVPAAPEPEPAPAGDAPAATTDAPAATEQPAVAEARPELAAEETPLGEQAAEADAAPGAVAGTAPETPAPQTPAAQAPAAAGDTEPETGAAPEAAPGAIAEAAPAPETAAEAAPASTDEASAQATDAPGTPEAPAEIQEPTPPAAEAAEGETVIARTDPAAPVVETPETVSPQVPAEARRPTVLVEAVEIEGRMVFVAGRAEPGMTVRVYANDIFLGEARGSEAGRFLIEVQRDLPVGDYIIRADLLDRGGRTVVARAAVPFQREEGESIAAVAPPAPPVSPAAPVSSAAPVAEPSPPPAATVQPGAPAPAQADTGQPPVADTPARPQDAAPAPDSATAPATAPATTQPPATTQAPAAAQPAPAAAEIAEVTAPKLQSVQGGVIIRRGDSLWRISRRVYGRGVRYSTIYVANQDQIADPHRIWPGQIFRLPKETEEGEVADLEAIGDQKTVIEPADGETTVQ